jgi:hypothetical protein
MSGVIGIRRTASGHGLGHLEALHNSEGQIAKTAKPELVMRGY